jgi:hypothetical protein
MVYCNNFKISLLLEEKIVLFHHEKRMELVTQQTFKIHEIRGRVVHTYTSSTGEAEAEGS